jgi:hypothetical protein
MQGKNDVSRRDLIATLILASVSVVGSQAAQSAAPADVGLVEAAKAGDRDAVRALLKQRARADAAEPDGTTALHWSVRADDLETTRLLIRAGASVRVANRFGVTPLSLAATNQRGHARDLAQGRG